MGFATQLQEGWAAMLAQLLPDLLLWEPEAPYPGNTDAAGQVPIYAPVLPHDRDRAIGITAYPVEESAGDSADIWAVQVRTRGRRDDQRSASDVDDAVFTAVQSLEHVELGGIPVTLVWRESSGPMGMDENRRHEWTSNYYLHTTRPTPHRLD